MRGECDEGIYTPTQREKRGRTAKGGKGAKGINTTTQRRDDATGEESFFQYSFRDPSGSWALGWPHSSSPKNTKPPQTTQGLNLHSLSKPKL